MFLVMIWEEENKNVSIFVLIIRKKKLFYELWNYVCDFFLINIDTNVFYGMSKRLKIRYKIPRKFLLQETKSEYILS